MATGSRQDQYLLHVVVKGAAIGGGDLDLGTWDKMSGGSVDSEEQRYKPGGMAEPISLGGSINPENVTAQVLYYQDTIHPRMGELMAAIGKRRVELSRQPLDIDKNPKGSPLVWTGILKQVTPPDVDSEGNDGAMLQIEFTTDGRPTGGATTG